ncbi:F0F1 ATP synthase subunit epsilon [Heliophilum fasciatum]|uniref:ATP synthase epsilon chain n=1 Tax=Heliophilum fasciatum TaxID=35700 RepID=A0A4V2SX83_9FIRM|nr:F0F1 ATP synthase subunit epsilon [Heliophilum fasciatum]MCW2277473.1 F-type H+-transporting ATPase subunit epsilon [Heliophilum fasciatum]TCP65236.1 ATP synthase F1 subcomplex epsilon subunit [Heliophilum fasciatum]
MANKTYRLEVVTPERLVLSDDVEFTSAPGAEGSIGILADHAPLLTALQIGVLEYTKDGQNQKLTVTGGFLEVGDGKVTVLSNASERPVEIDISRAEAARRRAEARIEEAKRGTEDADLARAEFALKRALLRIDVSKFD